MPDQSSIWLSTFFSVIHDLWRQRPGVYAVEETASDLVASLAQMSIKSLAADLRDSVPGLENAESVGWLKNDGRCEPLVWREALNKIVHGSPTRVHVQDGVVWLHFTNNTPDTGRPWDEAAVKASEVLRLLEDQLYVHRTPGAEDRKLQIREFLETLGPERFLPTATAGTGRRHTPTASPATLTALCTPSRSTRTSRP